MADQQGEDNKQRELWLRRLGVGAGALALVLGVRVLGWALERFSADRSVPSELRVRVPPRAPHPTPSRERPEHPR